MDNSKRVSKKNGSGLRKKVTEVRAQVAVFDPLRSRKIPSMKSNGVWTRVSHTEMFASVVSAGVPFAVTSYPCNPGVASIFPWLSEVADRYETYKFESLSFRFHTQQATSAVGTVTLAFDFDAADPAPSSLLQAASYRDRAIGAAWQNNSLKLDLVQGDKSRSRYTRVGLPASPYDLKTYDLGTLHVCTDGVAAATIGLLEAEYVVDLYTPQIQDPVGGKSASTAGMDATHLFGTSQTIDAQASLPGVFTSSSVFTFNQAFEGLVTFQVIGTVLSANISPVVSSSGTAYGAVTPLVNAAATEVLDCFSIRAVPGTTMTPTITATTVTSVFVFFSKNAYTSNF